MQFDKKTVVVILIAIFIIYRFTNFFQLIGLTRFTEGFTASLHYADSPPQTQKPYHRDGAVPQVCPAGLELEADARCYYAPEEGFECRGRHCSQKCPPGYINAYDNKACMLVDSEIGAYTQGCPWYDRCGLAAAKGCKKCPEGYVEEGCTCKLPKDLFVKSTYVRPSSVMPTGCDKGLVKSKGMCYQACRDGFVGEGDRCVPIAGGNYEITYQN